MVETRAYKPARNILSLSGGKDSTALAIHMRKTRPHIKMEYVFCDTGSELRETYAYLDQVQIFLGQKIVRLPQDMPNASKYPGFNHWLRVFGGYLPSPNMRWCTRQLKLKPFEDYIGDDPVVSYVGIRADEDRIGYISTKPNIKAVFPLREDGIDYAGVMRILQDSGIGLPPYLKWGILNAIVFVVSLAPAWWIRKRARAGDVTGCRIGLIVLSLFGAVNIVFRVCEFTGLNCGWSAKS